MSNLITTTVIADNLRQVWTTEEMQNVTYRAYPELQRLKNIRKAITGKDYSFLVLVEPSYATKFMAENGTLPTPVDEVWVRGYFNPKTVATRRFITQESIDDSGDDVGAIVQMYNYLPPAMADEHGFHLTRNLWNTSSGLMGAISSISTTTVTFVAGTNMRKFRVNDIFDVKNMTTGAFGATNCDSNTITNVDEDNRQVTTGSAITTGGTTTDFGFYLEDETTASGGAIVARAWLGIPELIGTGNVHSINTTTYPLFKSCVYTSTAALTLPKMQKGINWIQARFKMPKLEFWTSPEVLLEYSDLLIPDVQYDKSMLDRMRGGQVGGSPTFVAGTLGDVPINVSFLSPTNEMYLFDWRCFQSRTSAFMKFWDPEGSYWHRRADVLNLELTYYSRGEMAVINRLGTVKWTGITLAL